MVEFWLSYRWREIADETEKAYFKHVHVSDVQLPMSGTAKWLPAINALKCSNVASDEMQDPDHHHGESPLLELGIGMVSQFIIDYMHLISRGC